MLSVCVSLDIVAVLLLCLDEGEDLELSRDMDALELRRPNKSLHKQAR